VFTKIVSRSAEIFNYTEWTKHLSRSGGSDRIQHTIIHITQLKVIKTAF